jgi:hypothetical protein
VKVVNIAGVPAVPFSLDPATRDEYSFNYSSPDGDLEPVPSPSGPFAQLLAAEVPKYIGLWLTVFAPLSVPGYKNGVPTNLTISTQAWLTQNGFIALPIALVGPLAFYGYGDIRQTPIVCLANLN